MNTTPEERRRPGRPKSEAPREIIWPTRFSKEEAELIDKKAKRSGKPRAEWMRQVLLAA